MLTDERCRKQSKTSAVAARGNFSSAYYKMCQRERYELAEAKCQHVKIPRASLLYTTKHVLRL